MRTTEPSQSGPRIPARQAPSSPQGVRPRKFLYCCSLVLAAVVATAACQSSDSKRSETSRSGSNTLNRVTLVAAATDLGTLGGRDATPLAISGHLVVGESTTAHGDSHAFVCDVAAEAPRMRDLGTLGGPHSSASAVDGTIVVGDAETVTGDRHAFAIDVSDPSTPTVRDLGTLGGKYSYAIAVSGNLVVGNSSTADGGVRGFLYDLGAPSPSMRELTSMNGTGGAPSDVEGHIVIGTMQKPPKGGTTFAYDAAARPPRMRDIGPPGVRNSSPVDIDGGRVLGSAGGYPERPFVYDLNSKDAHPTYLDVPQDDGMAEAIDGPLVVGETFVGMTTQPYVLDLSEDHPTMRKLPLGTANTTDDARPSDVDGRVVVGIFRAADDTIRYWAFDLDVSQTRPADLGRTGQDADPLVSGHTVVGATPLKGHERATMWQLTTTKGPAVRFKEFGTSVKHNAGRVLVTVVRDGDSKPAVSVHYATRGANAGPFVHTEGTVTFRAGQREATLRIPIGDAPQTLESNRFVVSLTNPSPGAVISTPNVTQIEIAGND